MDFEPAVVSTPSPRGAGRRSGVSAAARRPRRASSARRAWWGYCIAAAARAATGGSGPEIAEAERHHVEGTDADRTVVLGTCDQHPLAVAQLECF